MKGWSLCGGGKNVGVHRPFLWTGGRESWFGDVAELKFLTEKELVTIIPNFSWDKTYCIRVTQDSFTLAHQWRHLCGWQPTRNPVSAASYSVERDGQVGEDEGPWTWKEKMFPLCLIPSSLPSSCYTGFRGNPESRWVLEHHGGCVGQSSNQALVSADGFGRL